MKRVYLTTFLTCAVILALFFCFFRFVNPPVALEKLVVGFIYDGDESTAYTYNFSLAKDALEKAYGDRIEIHTRSNVLESQTDEPLRELVGLGCNLIFSNGYSDQIKTLAPEFPGVQFCQTSYEDTAAQTPPENYHTFKGLLYQGRYVSGIAAGMKLRELIESGSVAPGGAAVGFVAAYPSSEVISGYTAFLLGIRSVVPQATMHVRYTYSWNSYSLERRAAQALIEEGCVVISQHSDTVGPATACEDVADTRPIIHIGYNRSMTSVAPTTSLISLRINWVPYTLSAAEAVMSGRRIESVVTGNVHGNDISAGFDRGWLEMTSLNPRISSPEIEKAVKDAVEQFRRGGSAAVFKGDYVGVNPDDPSDTYDLKDGYEENRNSSYPTFGYILKDVIVID